MSDQMSDNIIIQCDTVSTSTDIRKYYQYYSRNNICNNNKEIAKPNSEIFEFAAARLYDLWLVTRWQCWNFDHILSRGQRSRIMKIQYKLIVYINITSSQSKINNLKNVQTYSSVLLYSINLSILDFLLFLLLTFIFSRTCQMSSFIFPSIKIKSHRITVTFPIKTWSWQKKSKRKELESDIIR